MIMSSVDGKLENSAPVYRMQEFRGEVDDLFTDDKYKVLYRHRLACEKAQDTPSSGALERLQTWFREHGGVVHSSVELFEAGGDCNDREIKVVGEVRDRDCVLEIPLKLIMTLTKAQGTPLAVELQAQLDAEFKFLDDHDTWLAIFLLDEHSKAEESFYFPYLATLPSTYLTNPLYYNSEELSLLRGSMCLRHVKRHHDELIYEYAQLQTLLPAFTDKHSFERFVWARLSVLSRQFSMDYGRDGRDKEASLVPMLEMVNHDSAQRNVLWDFDTGSQSAKLVADGPLSATSTRDPHLYVSYGQKSNARLLLYYGFVMKNNDCEEAEVLCSFDRRVRGDAKGLDNTSVPYTPMNKQGWNEPSLHTTKLKFVSDLELIPLRCSAGPSETPGLIQSYGAAGAYVKCVSLESELDVLARLRFMCEISLQEFPDTMKDDLGRIAQDKAIPDGKTHTLKGGDAAKGSISVHTNAQNCFTMCFGEKETLWFWIYVCDIVTLHVKQGNFARGTQVFVDIISDCEAHTFFARHASRIKYVKMYLWELVDAQASALSALKHGGPLALD